MQESGTITIREADARFYRLVCAGNKERSALDARHRLEQRLSNFIPLIENRCEFPSLLLSVNPREFEFRD